MTSLAPHLTAFLRQRLPLEKNASSHTCDSYAYAFQLLLQFAAQQLKRAPHQLSLEVLDAPLILAFLEHLETNRHNSPRSRNARLAAIKSFMHFMEYRVPSALDQIRSILAIPFKKTDTRLVPYLSLTEAQALVNAPDPSTRIGIRDRAMLHLDITTGLRVSELVALCCDDLSLHPTATIRVHGKGRHERILPLWKDTTDALRVWLSVRGSLSCAELFPNRQGQPMSRSGFEFLLDKYVSIAAKNCPSLAGKRVSPHVLRHTCAMIVLQATGDVRKVSLWLGHASIQTTEIYTQADPTEKLELLGAVTPPSLHKGHFQPPDKLLAMLRSPP